MKLFIKRTLFFLLLLFVIGGILNLILPYHWGNPWYSVKAQYLERLDQMKYNTFFFGSSRVYRQINPERFDAILSQDSLFLSSFNMGAPGVFAPQSFYLYENFLNSAVSNKAKYCFLELTRFSRIGEGIEHQERSNYWVTWQEYLRICHWLYNNKTRSRGNQAKLLLGYTIGLFERQFHIGHFREQMNDLNYYNPHYLGPQKDGHLSLEDDIRTTTNKESKEGLIEKHQNLIDNPEELTERSRKSVSELSLINNAQVDQIYLQRIQNLLSQSERKGIYLTFILSPRHSYKEVFKIASLIPAEQPSRLK